MNNFKGTKGEWRVKEWASRDDVVSISDELIAVVYLH